MQVLINTSEPGSFSQINKEWYGREVAPPYCYRMTHTCDGLLFEAKRAEPAALHPDAHAGKFQEELWRYDVAEFFISTADTSRYMEMNLSPNGAWWGSVFTAPRVVDAAASSLLRVESATGEATNDGWQASLLLPQEVLDALGFHLPDCRIAVCAVLESPQYIYLTTAAPCHTQPDFHRPDLWQHPVWC